MTNKPLPPQEIREVVAQYFAEKEGADWIGLVRLLDVDDGFKPERQKIVGRFRREADQLLTKLSNKPLPPQEIREVVARLLAEHDGWDWEWIIETARGGKTSLKFLPTAEDCKEMLESYRKSALEFLSVLSKPPYNVVRLDDDQTTIASNKGGYLSGQELWDEGWRKVVPLVAGTVKEG